MVSMKQISSRTVSGKPALLTVGLLCLLFIGSQSQCWKCKTQEELQLSLKHDEIEKMDRTVLLDLPEQIEK